MDRLLLHAQETSHSTATIVIHKFNPVYTNEAIAAKLQGAVILSAMIGTDVVSSIIVGDLFPSNLTEDL